eukprot:92808-Pelagomonas_calceolata.AAC.3
MPHRATLGVVLKKRRDEATCSGQGLSRGSSHALTEAETYLRQNSLNPAFPTRFSMQDIFVKELVLQRVGIAMTDSMIDPTKKSTEQVVLTESH